MNKNLTRILFETFGFSSVEELTKELSASREFDAEQMGEFKNSFVECFEALDKAMDQLDEMIAVRDRSLAVSTKKMQALNEEVSNQSERQKSILNQLRTTIQSLGADGGAQPEGFDKLILEVDGLVKSQIEAATNSKLLYEEGIRLSSAMNLTALESQLKESIGRIVGRQVGVKMFFAARFFDLNDEGGYFSCDSKGRPEDTMETTEANKNVHFLTVNSAKGNGILSFARLECLDAADAPSLISHVQPLLPNIAATLENIRMVMEEKHKQHMAAELQTARFVQHTLLPSAKSIQGGGLEINGYYESATECGGDWWGHIPLADGTHLVLIGDVTGHGTASAMICAVVKGYCDSFEERRALSPAQVLSELNQVVHRVSSHGRRAMTMSAIVIDQIKNEIRFANAGHPHPILVRAAAESNPRTNRFLINSGPILGLAPKADFVEKKQSFQTGDWLLLYSDGLTEYANRKQEMFGISRIRRIIDQTNSELSAAEINRTLVRQLQDFTLGEEQKDDVTSVIIRNVGVAQAKAKAV